MKLFAAFAASLLFWCGATAQPLPPTTDAPYPGVIELRVDASDTDRRVVRVRETLPVRPGPLVLYYPSWLPGWHAPGGPIARLAGLVLRAGERRLAWQRNPGDVSAFHVEVPEGVSTLDAEFQYLAPLDGPAAFASFTREILMLSWNSVLLYPAGHEAARIRVQPQLLLPAGWSHASALEVASLQGAQIGFKPVDLDTLVDSPVMASARLRSVELDARGPVRLHIATETAGEAAATPAQIAAHAAMVVQADRLFGPRPFGRYDFLLAIGERYAGDGLEHGASSENLMPPGYFSAWDDAVSLRETLAHEYVHAWNGKRKRPADLSTPHFNTPMGNSLLWVYEGQTQFWGTVLAARSGLHSAQESRDNIALGLAWLESTSGRAWRNLQDTTLQPILDVGSDKADWRSWRRGSDYYGEGQLLWLEADALIRELSRGRRSLDDFARAFFGAAADRREPAGRPVTYQFDDVVQALQRVQPHDWAAFLRERLDTHDGGWLAGALRRSGWRLAWGDEPSAFQASADAQWKADDFGFSIGLTVGEGGKLAEVRWGGPAFDAGLAPGDLLVAVDGRAYKPELLRDAIVAARGGSAPITLLVRTGELFRNVPVRWAGGLRYPRLERIAGTPDHLGALLAPR